MRKIFKNILISELVLYLPDSRIKNKIDMNTYKYNVNIYQHINNKDKIRLRYDIVDIEKVFEIYKNIFLHKPNKQLSGYIYFYDIDTEEIIINQINLNTIEMRIENLQYIDLIMEGIMYE